MAGAPHRPPPNEAMSKRVEEILSWYESDNPGVLKNLRWMMDTGALAGTGKFVILPVDQGFEHGPARSFAKNPAGYDPQYHFELAIESGCNAYAAPLGFLEAGARKYAGRIPLILKLNNSDSLYSNADPKPAVTGSVKDALRLGCAAIGFTIYPRQQPARRDVHGAAQDQRGSQGSRPRGRRVELPARHRAQQEG